MSKTGRDGFAGLRSLAGAAVVWSALCGLAVGADVAPDPGFPFLVTSTQTMDVALCRTRAMEAEAAGKAEEALTSWERVIDRGPATEEQRLEARTHIRTLRPKGLRNTDPAKANSWKVLVIIFRQLDFSWTDKDQKLVHVQKTISAENEKKIRGSIEAYGRHVFKLSSGMLRLDTEFQVVEAPVTNLHGSGQGPFSPAPHLLLPLIKPLVKDRQYDTVFGYVKYNGDQGPSVPAPFTAATYASIGEVNGAGFVMVPWHTNYPYPGETDGEMELHEWLHQIDWMFTSVLHYPEELVPSSDTGRMEGDTRPGGDPDYFRKKEETTWIGLYRHIMEDHITRQMWFEARMFPEKKELKGRGLGFDTLLMIQRRPLNPTHVYTYHVEGLAQGGGLFTLSLKDGKLTRLVDASDGVILDCQVSYDGKQVLFSWKRTMQEPFKIWRINKDGSGLTCVIDHASNNMNACWLPDGGIAFLSDRKPAFAYCWTSTSPVLFRANGNGQNVIKLSANYLTDFTPSIMEDGRILFSRWEYVDRPAIPIQSLWAINPDGTLLAGVFGNRVLSPATFMEAKDIPGMPGKILCVMTSHNGPCRGAIGLLDLTKGGNAQEAIRNLTPEVSVGPVGDAGAGNGLRGPYESPVPLDARTYLVSRAGRILLRDYAGTLDAVLCEPDKDLGFYSAQPLRGRPMPRSPRPSRVDPKAEPWATVVMHDVMIGLGDAVKPGEIKRIAVVQEMEKDMRAETDKRQFGFQFPVVSCGATYAPKRVWGFANVEVDGSAHFKVPAGLPLYFLPLDAEGRAVQRMRTFTHFMPGEKQSCIGCHADRNYVAPAGLRGGRSIAAGRPVQELAGPEWGRRDGFSFARVVQPVLNARCVRCHDEKAKLDLSGDRTDYFNVAYENLARRGTQAEHGGDAGGGMAAFGKNLYTSWIPSYNGCESNILQIQPKSWGSPVSRLAEVVIAGHPDDKGKKRVALSAGERLKILMWIDLNVPFYGTSQSRQPELRGCRQILPKGLDEVLKEVAERRKINLPRTFYVRLDHPEKNVFLAEPLAKGAFASADDPDYKRILACFDGVQEALAQRIDVDFRTVIGSACDGGSAN